MFRIPDKQTLGIPGKDTRYFKEELQIYFEENWASQRGRVILSVVLVGPKCALCFLSKNKRHIFHFHQELY